MARLIVRREPRGDEEGVPAGAIVGSLSLHTFVVLFMVWGATRLAIPEPPVVYQVELMSLPREAPVREVPVEETPPPREEEQPEPRPIETQPAPTTRPREESRPVEEPEEEEQVEEQTEPEPPPVETKPAATEEQSLEGVEGLPVRLEGAPFPYPEYLANIILQIKRHWRPPTGGQQLRAELAFRFGGSWSYRGGGAEGRVRTTPKRLPDRPAARIVLLRSNPVLVVDSKMLLSLQLAGRRPRRGPSRSRCC
jgi:hypothetical protein